MPTDCHALYMSAGKLYAGLQFRISRVRDKVRVSAFLFLSHLQPAEARIPVGLPVVGLPSLALIAQVVFLFEVRTHTPLRVRSSPPALIYGQD